MARKQWYLKPETIARLKKYGKFGETQDTLINRILDELEDLKNRLVK
jgi:hypothetical protein